MTATWHHKAINRLETEKLLLGCGEDGGFLIRDSESIPNAFVLSILFQGHIHHYRILREKDGRLYMQAATGVASHKFESLEQIVTFYSQPNQGLPCELKYPVVSKDTTEEDYSDEDEEDDEDDEPDGAVAIVNELPDPAQLIAQNMSQMDSNQVDGKFLAALGHYLGEGLLKDLDSVEAGGKTLDELQNLISGVSHDLVRELKTMVSRISFLEKVFSIGLAEKTKLFRCSSLVQQDEDMTDFDHLNRLLAGSIAGVKSLQTQAVKALEDVNKIRENSTQQEVEKPQKRVFEVQDKTPGFKSKNYLAVDYVQGKLAFLKNQNDPLDDSNTCDQSKVLQLIKSRDNMKRLGIKLESKPLKEFDFDDGKSREVFCQLVQQIKNQQSKGSAIDEISVFVGTWNLGSAVPPHDLRTWFKCQGHGTTTDTDVAHFAHDIYAIGTQECSLSEKDWVTKVKSELQRIFNVEFFTVSVSTLWEIRLVILARPEHNNMISHVRQSSVKTGIANALGNKGAVGISFLFGATSFCFINCHLAARASRVLRRNQNFHSILKGLNLGQKNVFDLTNQFHHVFWFGDLNYRIDLEVKEVLEAVKGNNFYKLRKADQLMHQITKGNAFVDFKEGYLTFPPTYRHRRGFADYVWEKAKRSGILVNVPSWCDRVLWHSFPEMKIVNTSYGCTDNIRTSDHWPVFSTFDVGITTQYASSPVPQGSSTNDCVIIFETIKAMINTNSKPQFVVEFYSSCLESVQRSNQNSVRDWVKKTTAESREKTTYAAPSWGSQVLPHLHPIMPDRMYLQDQHLLIAVKSVESDESYGECCISLKAMIAETPQDFEAKLTHSGQETGSLSGQMRIKLADISPALIGGKPKGLIKVEGDDDVNSNKLDVRSTRPVKRKSVMRPDFAIFL
ncbi:phosphatidylinositol 3,4,5-trisphosphate 5-phosphatase 2A isoform X2 [Nematostella vectensis]|uniref:phosphatidylinositol 3,4,5-trisphosphate 5-phosphatase 2A isoform X2 n=1 Tax=Nematostella vectensis TaxID=45351 RepID=UPI00138FC755|nr:phosphatidylinositol 3,4,5-trisphosphate 5-phosphatase 2A isoform X2 [Nematostella vectensis]